MALAVALRGQHVARCGPGVLQAVWDAYYADYDGWVGIPEHERVLRLDAAVAAARAIIEDRGHFYRKVSAWVDNPDTFSPHIDRIAVERAKALDGDVIANLTGAEWNLVVDELAHLPLDRTPWADARAGGGGSDWRSRKAEERDDHEWWALPAEIRTSLASAVSRRRILLDFKRSELVSAA